MIKIIWTQWINGCISPIFYRGSGADTVKMSHMDAIKAFNAGEVNFDRAVSRYFLLRYRGLRFCEDKIVIDGGELVPYRGSSKPKVKRAAGETVRVNYDRFSFSRERENIRLR